MKKREEEGGRGLYKFLQFLTLPPKAQMHGVTFYLDLFMKRFTLFLFKSQAAERQGGTVPKLCRAGQGSFKLLPKLCSSPLPGGTKFRGYALTKTGD